MPGYLTKQEDVPVAGVANIVIRSLLDRQQYADPGGEADGLGISSAAWPLFGVLWPSGSYLAARIAARPVRKDERILEIGCGLALASLVGHRRGADVTASDCHPLAARFLKENLRLNGLSPMKYRHGRWGAGVETVGDAQWRSAIRGECAVAGRYELIMGSDLLYERDERGELADFIASHAMPEAEVWIIDPDRGNRSHFRRNMERQGFGLEEVQLRRAASPGLAAYKGRCLVYRRNRPLPSGRIADPGANFRET
jgi:predicted nicotinamide N-methyase